MRALILAATLAALGGASAPALADPRLNVVELYESQGCSSCPPANANVASLVARDDVLALTFAVTYWDYLGWKDTFASPAFTVRQEAYARGLGRDGVYTPQVVVNGRANLTGIDAAELDRAVRRNVRPPDEPAIELTDGVVAVGRTRRASDVWLVDYDPRTIEVPIARGENGGRTLPHRNMVRSLVHLGRTSPVSVTRLSLPRIHDPRWRRALLVQEPEGGPIRAAARLDPR